MIVARWLPTILLSFVLCGCAPSENKQGTSKPTGTTLPVSAPSSYHFLNADSMSSDESEEARQALPYDEIQLARTECEGSCPSYVVTFRRDGSATYVGRAHVKNIGKFSGSISVFDYGKLCWAIEKFKLTELQPTSFVSGKRDIPSTILRVKAKQTGARTELLENGLPGPIELWVVQNSIDKLASEMQWRASQDSLIRRQNSGNLIDDVARITLVTPNASALKESIRVDVPDAAKCDQLINSINRLAIEGDGTARNQEADMRALDVELLILDHSGFGHSIGLFWEQSDKGLVVYEHRVYQVSAGLTSLRQLIVNNSSLPEFGGLQPESRITK